MRPVHKKLLFSVALTLLLTEAALRIYVQAHPSILAYHPNRYLRFKARPGSLSYGFPINPDGFKDMPFEPRKRDGRFRIAAIGDSCVFSMVPYEQSFCTVLETLHGNLEVMNFGIIGTGPTDYVAILKDDALRYDPDAVLLFLFAGNDFLPPRKRWYDVSCLATFLHHALIVFRHYDGQDVRQDYTYDDDMTPFSYAGFVETESAYAETFLMSDRRFDRILVEVMQSVNAMDALCRKQGIAFRVVILPDRLQLEPQLQNDVAEALREPLSSFDFSRPQDQLAQALSAGGIRHVDLSGRLAEEEGRTYIHHDIHLNIHGNRLVAEALPEEWMRHN